MKRDNDRNRWETVSARSAGSMLLGALLWICPASAADREAGPYIGFGGGNFGVFTEAKNFEIAKHNAVGNSFVGYQNDFIGTEAGVVNFGNYELFDKTTGNTTHIRTYSAFARLNLQLPIWRDNQGVTALYASGGGHS